MITVPTIITDYLEIQMSEDHSVAHAQQSATRKKNAKQCHLMKRESEYNIQRHTKPRKHKRKEKKKERS